MRVQVVAGARWHADLLPRLRQELTCDRTEELEVTRRLHGLMCWARYLLRLAAIEQRVAPADTMLEGDTTMIMPAESVRPRNELMRELAPLIAGTEGLGVAALVNLETGKALTLGEPPKATTASGTISGTQLVLLARALSGRASEAELTQLSASCIAQGGVTTASLLLTEHDLVLSRMENSTDALCLVVRHAPASIAALDSIVQSGPREQRFLPRQWTTRTPVQACRPNPRPRRWSSLRGSVGSGVPALCARQAGAAPASRMPTRRRARSIRPPLADRPLDRGGRHR